MVDLWSWRVEDLEKEKWKVAAHLGGNGRQISREGAASQGEHRDGELRQAHFDDS